ncbi:SdpA family antimicrobial peptide system protein [Scopulibacillus cellulosilyticus]|uniref:SdpA family antimicrobial peptide system protein n=1 Tax=Scopulibacillus cellulosilyticus TaxID=2665665 RepID=A0ABW2Q0Z9_9BACL
MVALPSAVVSPTGPLKGNIHRLYTQGWGFFSKNPEDEVLNIYNPNSMKPESEWPNNSLKHLFGLNRKGREEGIELGAILARLPDKGDWNTGKIKNNIHYFKIKNPSWNDNLHGKMIIAYEKITPWAWSEVMKKKKIVRYIGVDVI